MNKVVAIIGPTATGKTKLAIGLCQKFNGEIISVDSRQAYKGMEVGTGKRIQISDVRYQKREVPIHLYDLIEPDQPLNAHDYSQAAWEKIEDIWSREKTPFLVGGTGFYLDVILGRRHLSGAGVDSQLRSELKTLTREELVERLGRLNPEKLRTIDVNNKYRLIRAVEIALGHGQAKFIPAPETLKQVQGDVLTIGLTADNSYLYPRADGRIERMVEAGLVEEVRILAAKYGWAAPGLKALGYRELRPYFEGTIQLNEAIQKFKFNTHAYIRRQKTYFKKYFSEAAWFDVWAPGFDRRVEEEVESFLTG